MGRWSVLLLVLCTAPANAAWFWLCADPHWVPVLQDYACTSGQHTLLGSPAPAQSTTAAVVAPPGRPPSLAGARPGAPAFSAPGAPARVSAGALDVLDEPVFKSLWLVAAAAIILSFVRVVLFRDRLPRLLAPRGNWYARRHAPLARTAPLEAIAPPPGPLAVVSPRPRPNEWSARLIEGLAWDRFQTLCGGLWHFKGYRVEISPRSTEHSVDFFVYERAHPGRVFAAVQCVAWKDGVVGEDVVQDLWRAASQLEADMALLYSTCAHSEEAVRYVAARHMRLILPEELLDQLSALEDGDRAQLLRAVTRDDGEAPCCPNCGTRATMRVGGPRIFRWICRNGSPSCAWEGLEAF